MEIINYLQNIFEYRKVNLIAFFPQKERIDKRIYIMHLAIVIVYLDVRKWWKLFLKDDCLLFRNIVLLFVLLV